MAANSLLNCIERRAADWAEGYMRLRRSQETLTTTCDGLLFTAGTARGSGDFLGSPSRVQPGRGNA